MFYKDNKLLAAFDNDMNAATEKNKAKKTDWNGIGGTSGILEIIRYHKDNFLIGILDNDVPVKGSMCSPQIGMEYHFEGKWVSHPKYGESFSFDTYKTSYPKDLWAIRLYLIENCKWIGKEISKKIVNTFGEKTLDICKNEPERVSEEIPGITLKRAQEITDTLKINEKSEHVQLELKKILSGVRISKRAVNKIMELYKHKAPEKIKENPYRLIDDIDGIGFLTADAIAMEVGFAKTGKPRIRAGIIHVFKDGAMSGHTRLPLEIMFDKINKLLGFCDNKIKWMLKDLDKEGVLVPVGEYCLKIFHEKEKLISEKLINLSNNKDKKFNNLDEPLLKELADDQVEAIQKVVKNKVFILTGAPGTGKTYLLKRIIEAFPDIISERIILAAPTGKAAKRMTEQSGRKALTMHRVLEPKIDCESNKKPVFQFTKCCFNTIDADLVILDEASMIDVSLMASFLDAMSPKARLIMIGDIYQLPSVGPGNVLKDMINSGLIPTTELTIIKRQDEGLIIQNCHKIKNGGSIEVNNSKSKDFFFLKSNNEAGIKKTIIELISKRLPEAYKADPLKDIQIISPLREKTGLSCKWLNKACQEVLNKNPGIEKIPFKVGDKVIQTKNDYELGVINGDVGFIHSINLGNKTIYVDFQNIEEITEIPLYGNNLELAYSLTCHKFQGSESRIVIIPIHKSFGPLIMQRNWLYTAISRAKEVCILVGQREEIPKIIRRNKQQKRFTNLEQFLKEEHNRLEKGEANNDRLDRTGQGFVRKDSDAGNGNREHGNDVALKDIGHNTSVLKKVLPKKESEQPKKEQKTYNLLEQAILALADSCDGAIKEDGEGFNMYDADPGHTLADMILMRENNGSVFGRLSFDEYEEAYHMLRKYRKQLMRNGIDYERITPEPIRKRKRQ